MCSSVHPPISVKVLLILYLWFVHRNYAIHCSVEIYEAMVYLICSLLLEKFVEIELYGKE